MKISVVAIGKSEDDAYDRLGRRFMKMSGRFAKVETQWRTSRRLSKAQESGSEQAYAEYYTILSPLLKNGYNIAMHPAGRVVDTEAFAGLLQNKPSVNFFISGAYGHGEAFLKKCDDVITLSALTFSHKIAYLVLMEQIYRALSVNFSHPYHK